MSGVPTDPPPPHSRQRLINWANGQDLWVREIVRQILASRHEMSADALEVVYNTLLAEKELSTEAPPNDFALSLGAGEADSIEPLRLERLGDVEHVNALTSGQEILFNPRLTVLFGENASGKSGYVRILKMVAAVRSKEKILPDVRKPSPTGSPRAQLRFTLGNVSGAIEWNGEEGVAPFTRMSIFDTRAVTLHVDEPLSYVYTPRDLALFSLAHRALEATRDRLDRARREMQPQGNPFLPQFERGSSVYPKVETLGAQADLVELEALASVTEEQAEELSALRNRVRALESETDAARLQIAREDRELYKDASEAAKAIERFDCAAHTTRVETARRAAERFVNATQRAFAGDEIPAVLSEPWSAFIQAGEEYLKHLGANHHGEEKEACIYCRQPLGPAAVALIKKYRDYCNNTLRQESDATNAAVAAGSRPIVNLDLRGLSDRISRRLSAIDPRDRPAALTSAADLLLAAMPLQEELTKGAIADAATVLPFAGRAETLAAAASAQAEQVIATLTAEAEERARLVADASARLRGLEARLKLRELMPEVRKYVERAKWAAKAAAALASFQGVLRSLTMAAKAASEQLLNQDFDRLFAEERAALGAPEVKVEFPGREGETKRRKTLVPGFSLSEVLSEGEQKVIALADFLAEASLPMVSAPIIFDDPVNSLDYKRLHHVVDRMVKLSDTHQVIVFTHNIWFAVEILSRFEKMPKQCAYHEVTADSRRVGVVEAGAHPRWDTPGKIAPRINKLIQDAQKESGVIREALVRTGYSEIRTWCEAAVEQELFRGATRRYQPHVRMTALAEIKTNKLEAAISVIQQKFDKACRMTEAHSQPLETLGTKPHLDDLRQDWQALEEALKAYRS
jgi:hypothetical protein